MTDITDDSKILASRALESVLFCLWYVAANALFAWAMLAIWHPGQPEVGRHVVIWTSFAFATTPLPFVIWFVWASPRADLGWARRIAIAVAIVLIVSLMTGIVSTGLNPRMLAIYGAQGLVAAVATIWIFEAVRRRLFRRGG